MPKNTNEPRINFKLFSLSERSISMILGLLVVITIGGLIFNYFHQKTEEMEILQEQQNNEKTEKTKLSKDSNGVSLPTTLPTAYTVEKNDHLWKIAEKFYHSGYNWIDIAQENNLTNGNLIYTGQELKIPDVKARVSTIKETPQNSIAVSPGSYTVVKGDSLSSIALRAYGDLFAWDKIFQANISVIGKNPNLIHSGLVLTIPQ